MLKIDIPGFKSFDAEHLVLDFNGTAGTDGKLIEGVAERLRQLSRDVIIHVVTADTFGMALQELRDLPVIVSVISSEHQDVQKLRYIQELGPEKTIAAGNGRNDMLMLKEAALGIGLIQTEGACSMLILNTHVVCTSIIDALDLLIYPKRLLATLRN